MRGRPVSLLWRLLGTNGAVIAIGMAFLSLTPARIPAPGSLGSVLVLIGAMTVVLVANLFLLSRALSPLRRLTEVMRRIDPLRPGERIPVYGSDAEVVELTEAFNEMAERLEIERRGATRRAVEAQEGERQRIARELHDEIGQGLTASLLQLEGVLKSTPPELAPRLSAAMSSVRGSLEEARKVASRLRPEALDDLGLVSALRVLGKRLAKQTGIEIKLDLDSELPPLSQEEDIVVYRIAQEALTNVMRHADARRAEVSLKRAGGRVRLSVSDDGVGLHDAPAGGGVLGMQERALLIGATVTVRDVDDGGAIVELELPWKEPL